MANDTRVGQRPRRHRTNEEKRRIVEETLGAGASVSVVARRHDVNANQVFTWRRQHQRGELGGFAELVPVGVVGAGGIVSTIADVTKPQAARASEPCVKPAPSVAAVSGPPKMIEVELRGGTKIRMDADVKGSTLQQILKLIRSLA